MMVPGDFLHRCYLGQLDPAIFNTIHVLDAPSRRDFHMLSYAGPSHFDLLCGNNAGSPLFIADLPDPGPRRAVTFYDLLPTGDLQKTNVTESPATRPSCQSAPELETESTNGAICPAPEISWPAQQQQQTSPRKKARGHFSWRHRANLIQIAHFRCGAQN
jgi:hypothetical protein